MAKSALAKIKEHPIGRKPGSLVITVPKVFLQDNAASYGDKLVMFRNASDPSELVIKVQKNENRPSPTNDRGSQTDP